MARITDNRITLDLTEREAAIIRRAIERGILALVAFTPEDREVAQGVADELLLAELGVEV
jgi:hypothetical protein